MGEDIGAGEVKCKCVNAEMSKHGKICVKHGFPLSPAADSVLQTSSPSFPSVSGQRLWVVVSQKTLSAAYC